MENSETSNDTIKKAIDLTDSITRMNLAEESELRSLGYELNSDGSLKIPKELEELLDLAKEGVDYTKEDEKAMAVIARIANSWFDPKSFESEELYEKLGVKLFKKYMPTSGDLVYKYIWKSLGYKDQVRLNNIEQEIIGSKTTEKIHILAFGFYNILIAYYFSKGMLFEANFNLLANIITAVYSIAIQRYKRLRLSKVEVLKKRRELRRQENLSKTNQPI